MPRVVIGTLAVCPFGGAPAQGGNKWPAILSRQNQTGR
jgi:hypothetical protein